MDKFGGEFRVCEYIKDGNIDIVGFKAGLVSEIGRLCNIMTDLSNSPVCVDDHANVVANIHKLDGKLRVLYAMLSDIITIS
jgi:hypothetical protein